MEQNRIERAPTLGARLQKCADFVREGKKLADIGTDHGYVPVCLLPVSYTHLTLPTNREV